MPESTQRRKPSCECYKTLCKEIGCCIGVCDCTGEEPLYTQGEEFHTDGCRFTENH